MAKQTSVSDPYLDFLKAQIAEKEKAIEAAIPKKLYEEKAELEASLKNYKAYIKSQSKDS